MAKQQRYKDLVDEVARQNPEVTRLRGETERAVDPSGELAKLRRDIIEAVDPPPQQK